MALATQNDTVSAHDVAAYIIRWFQESDESDLTQLKLQKLLYYCQGYFLALSGQPLFNESVSAWEHGPVVAEVYDLYKGEHGRGKYPINEAISGDPNRLSHEQQEICDEVLEIRGQFSAWKLREMTHEEAPWIEAFQREPNSVISRESMLAFFADWVVHDREEE
jgi:uncharacterized phage-associated protein